MDEKHAFLLVLVMGLCVIVAIASILILVLNDQLAQLRTENDFIKQHLGLEKVNVGVGVQFAEDSFVYQALAGKTNATTCSITIPAKNETCPEFSILYQPEFDYVWNSTTLTIFMPPKLDWIQTDILKLPTPGQWKLVNWTSSHPNWEVSWCKTDIGNATYPCHKQYVTVMDGSPRVIYLRARSESVKAMTDYTVSMRFGCEEQEKIYTVNVKVG